MIAAMRPPSIEGIAARAWQVGARNPSDPRSAIHVASWLIDAPASHLVWPWKVLYCVALREAEGVDAPLIARAGVTHEVGLVAIYEEGAPNFAERIDAFEAGTERFPFVLPHDACRQIAVRSDSDAEQVCTAIVRAFCEGRLVPDEDYRRAIHGAIDGTAACIAAGGHEPS